MLNMIIRYQFPDNWIRYDVQAVIGPLVEAKACVMSLRSIPYQREWVNELQLVQLKREIAGTSRIEGADFTEGELDAAMREGTEQLRTRSQRQARAAMKAYQWIARVPDDQPIDVEFICRLHTVIVTDADDDHCHPGALRGPDHNVVFGTPTHRGADGGAECSKAFSRLCEALQGEFRAHDTLIQALALHYHFAAMHPFGDGNGRTARALEALVLQRAGLRDVCFIPMSNYYYDEKPHYLAALANVRAKDHDLTDFIVFGLLGIKLQCERLLAEIHTQIQKALFEDVMFDLFHRLKTPKRRVIVARQIESMELLLKGPMTLSKLIRETEKTYEPMKMPTRALIRDINELIQLGAVQAERQEGGEYLLSVRLTWPTEITQTEFFRRISELPKAKTHKVLQY